MNRTKYLKGQCQSCTGHIEFPAEAVGTSIDCPHCGQATELLLALPPEEPTIPRRTMVWTAITVLILLAGLAGALVALKRAERKAATRQQITKADSAVTQPRTQSAATPAQPE